MKEIISQAREGALGNLGFVKLFFAASTFASLTAFSVSFSPGCTFTTFLRD
jgi:hypothetical protein